MMYYWARKCHSGRKRNKTRILFSAQVFTALPIAGEENFYRSMKKLLSKFSGKVRQMAVIAAGFTILAVGIAMIVLPGPAIIVIPLGLGILATEFTWARSLLDKAKKMLKKEV
jgi:uncharacterized protein (TIGR02611 family)